jgi:hypothetical protein
MDPSGLDVHPARIDVCLLAPADVRAMGDTALAHCLRAVLERDPCAEAEVPAWDSFVS